LESLGACALDEVKLDEARACFDEGLRVAGEDDLLGARMLLGLANHELQHDRNEEARRLLHDALPRAERGGDRILLGRIANNLGIALFNEGSYADAIGEFRRALEVRRGLGYRHGEVINLHNIGDALLRLGDIARAYASFEQSHDLARSCGWDRAVAMNEVFLLFLRGIRGEEVGAELDRASSACAKLGDRETAITGRWFHARLRSDREGVRAALADADTAGLRGLSRDISATM
jgi:eukaryotic-like serine/threonine-protein kinase